MVLGARARALTGDACCPALGYFFHLFQKEYRYVLEPVTLQAEADDPDVEGLAWEMEITKVARDEWAQLPLDERREALSTLVQLAAGDWAGTRTLNALKLWDEWSSQVTFSTTQPQCPSPAAWVVERLFSCLSVQ